MFYSSDISEARAAATCLALARPLGDFAGLAGYSCYKKRRPEASNATKVRPALFTMPMGDLNAVDFA
eukprot:11861203-Alexandrium_andersonii.AAC.1